MDFRSKTARNFRKRERLARNRRAFCSETRRNRDRSASEIPRAPSRQPPQTIEDSTFLACRFHERSWNAPGRFPPEGRGRERKGRERRGGGTRPARWNVASSIERRAAGRPVLHLVSRPARSRRARSGEPAEAAPRSRRPVAHDVGEARGAGRSARPRSREALHHRDEGEGRAVGVVREAVGALREQRLRADAGEGCGARVRLERLPRGRHDARARRWRVKALREFPLQLRKINWGPPVPDDDQRPPLSFDDSALKARRAGAPLRSLLALANPRETPALNATRRWWGGHRDKPFVMLGPTGLGKTTAAAWVCVEFAKYYPWNDGPGGGRQREPLVWLEATELVRLTEWTEVGREYVDRGLRSSLLVIDAP